MIIYKFYISASFSIFYLNLLNYLMEICNVWNRVWILAGSALVLVSSTDQAIIFNIIYKPCENFIRKYSDKHEIPGTQRMVSSKNFDFCS